VDGDPWGILRSVADSPIGHLVPVVSGEDMSHALHGYFLPLRRQIGRSPHTNLRLVSDTMVCAQIKDCILADKAVCFPCKKMPHCYLPPGYEGIPAHAISTVIRAWAEGRYVVVVEGPEFSL
jgi:hypothetical protein